MRSTTLIRSTILAILLGSVMLIRTSAKNDTPTILHNEALHNNNLRGNNNPNTHNHRQTSARIIGGTPTPPNSYTYFTSLVRRLSNSHYCGGSLISPTLVLSAAHCRSSGLLPNVVIGRNDFTNIDEGESISVVEELIHPKYGNVVLQDGGEGAAAAPNYDFMLLRLERPVSLPGVQFVRLHNTNNDNGGINTNINLEEGQKVTVIGHGYTSTTTSKISNQLLQVQLTTISNEQCKSNPIAIPNRPWTMYDRLITDQMICAESIDGERTDSCQGDSGGPMVVRGEDGVDLEVGVVSWGYGCAVEGYPGVNARVSEAYNWIREEVCRESNNSNSSSDLTPEYFGCPRTTTAETKAATESPTLQPTTNPSTIAPSSMKETSVSPSISPSSDAPTQGSSSTDLMQSNNSTSAPTLPQETQFPTSVPTEQPTDVPTSFAEDEEKTIFIESPTFAPTMGMDVAVPFLVVEEPL